MYIYPAIDLYGGKAVRLLKGDYAQMTVYSDDPVSVAKDFAAAGASHIHLVDLEGAKLGRPANLDSIRAIVETTGLFAEVGGGIREMETVDSYLAIGVSRVILGTAAVKEPDFLKAALQKYGEKIAVGVDLKDGYVAIKGWTETSDLKAEEFFGKMQALGVKTIICTDISRDGAMKGANRALYRELSAKFDIDLIASGGVSSMEDVTALAAMRLHGAIIGKAYYIGAVDLKKAVEAAE
ncbi:MAG: 1-(5-phosphoribosyl)-5-[(5-phosphoribosylamino)methylideneamino]imidazole-4-carboxamide isomerase [Candidatus Faecousia sp.]|nr:1-(5-phosphoribosyl)-5-[(5-phosphoribosylamino)methylideneamino]imidazole-4-carboxamide isomerase [Clostridiales bacterium]MDD5882890.1 1-(5-phosphoribosyl)-5-[(5-phosphoribosylamino)methylideneamino]imidazole-4-carboxamide isomerase [Bacillota bacterium]MDY4598896.1 1-(5-phosphoribosyl)-5-[(5-phosphoribosylamino)methylideneamino]imidazole-4-carboxamide isomerase [Candidatus Faecousia sp.]